MSSGICSGESSRRARLLTNSQTGRADEYMYDIARFATDQLFVECPKQRARVPGSILRPSAALRAASARALAVARRVNDDRTIGFGSPVSSSRANLSAAASSG